MRRTLYACFFLVGIVHAHALSQPESPESILKKAAAELERHQSMSYTAQYRLKSFSGDDTLILAAACELFRDTTDSLFGGFIRYKDPGPWIFPMGKSSDRIGQEEERVYDGKQILSIFHKRKAVTVYDVHEEGDSPLTGHILFSVVSKRFLRPARVTDLLHPGNTMKLTGDAVIDDHPCWAVAVKKPDTDEYTDNVLELFVRKDTWWIVKTTARVTFQEQQQYEEWLFSRITFDTLPREHFTGFKPPIGYTVNQYKRPGEEKYTLLQNETQAPEFIGFHFQSGDTVTLSAYRGKTVLLDFWYMSCYPCIKAIPTLIELHTDYADSGLVVLGLNSFDTDEKARTRLPEFMRINKVNYPVLLTGRDVDRSYKVKVYPTLYLIDREGKVVHSQLGHGEGTRAAFQPFIEREIRRYIEDY